MHQSPRRKGLTLTELVVVLTILAILATVMVVSLDTAVDQARYDHTRRSLDAIQEAVIGSPDRPDAPCFVSDIGRLPLAVGDDPATQLAELWSNPRGLPAFGLTVSSTDMDVKLLGGWRGPYVRLPIQPVGSSRLIDGWGNPYSFLLADGLTPAGADDPIAYVRSGGGAAPYNFALATTPFLISTYTGTITGVVEDSDPVGSTASQDVTVKLYQVGATGLVEPTPANGLAVPATQMTGFTFTFTNVPIGQKVLRAYQTYTPSGGGSPISIKSAILQFKMPPGGITRTIKMDLH